MESWIETYGYVAVLVGTFVEGETVLVLAGFAAHRGYLYLPLVILVSFVGTLAGGQVLFLLGRFRRDAVLELFPSWRTRLIQVRAMAHRHADLLTLLFRFLWGIRALTPFVLGLGGMSAKRFLVLNAVGGIIWATAFGIAGFYVGEAVKSVLGEVKRFEGIIAVVIAVAGAAAWAVHFGRRNRRLRS